MFSVIEKEMQWREDRGLPKGFDTMRRCKPIVAVGAKEPLGGQMLMADYYRSFLPNQMAQMPLLTVDRWYGRLG